MTIKFPCQKHRAKFPPEKMAILMRMAKDKRPLSEMAELINVNADAIARKLIAQGWSVKGLS